MQTLRRTWDGGLAGQLLIGCGGLIILSCICAIPLSLLGGLIVSSGAIPALAPGQAELGTEPPIAVMATSTPMPTFTSVPSPTVFLFPTYTPTPIQPTATPIPTDTPIPTAAPPTEEIVVSVTVLAEVLNVRSGPGTGYEKVGQVREGDQLVVVARNETGEWLKTGDGWIAAEFVETTGDLNSLPVISGQSAVTTGPPSSAQSKEMPNTYLMLSSSSTLPVAKSIASSS